MTVRSTERDTKTGCGVREMSKTQGNRIMTVNHGIPQVVLAHMPWLIPVFYKPNYGPLGSKHVAQLLVA